MTHGPGTDTAPGPGTAPLPCPYTHLSGAYTVTPAHSSGAALTESRPSGILNAKSAAGGRPQMVSGCGVSPPARATAPSIAAGPSPQPAWSASPLTCGPAPFGPAAAPPPAPAVRTGGRAHVVLPPAMAAMGDGACVAGEAQVLVAADAVGAAAARALHPRVADLAGWGSVRAKAACHLGYIYRHPVQPGLYIPPPRSTTIQHCLPWSWSWTLLSPNHAASSPALTRSPIFSVLTPAPTATTLPTTCGTPQVVGQQRQPTSQQRTSRS